MTNSYRCQDPKETPVSPTNCVLTRRALTAQGYIHLDDDAIHVGRDARAKDACRHREAIHGSSDIRGFFE